MKKLLAILMCLGAVASAQQEWHTFTSREGGKTFEGKVVAYREDGDLVTVKRKGDLRILNFKLDVLSDADREFVMEQAPGLIAAGAVRLSFDKSQEKLDDDKARRYSGCYRITVVNTSPSDLQDVTVDYVVIYQKGSLAKGSTIEVDSGSQSFEKLAGNMENVVTTSGITLQSAASRDKEACSGST
jgi:hypothetical protein